MKRFTSYICLLWCSIIPAIAQQSENHPEANHPAPAATITPATVLQNPSNPVIANYVREITPRVPVQDETALGNVSGNYVNCGMMTAYTDGMGRPLQTVRRKFAAPGKDIVQAHSYDAFGREIYTALPYVKQETTESRFGSFDLTPASNLTSTYSSLGYTSEPFLYTQTSYDPSPLARVLGARAQGSSWVGAEIGSTQDLATGTSADAIRKWTISSTSGALPATTSEYAAGTIWVKTVTDEDGLYVKTYYDGQGLLVCSENGELAARTYYVYDAYNRLRYTIPPAATADCAANSWVVTTDIATKQCFINEYDARGRLVSAKKPGVDLTAYVYNSKDQVIFSQDALQKANSHWIFYKYDVMGRLVQKGTYSGNITQRHTAVFTLVDYVYDTEIRSQADYIGSFTGTKICLTNYYDTYAFTTRSFSATLSAVAEGYDNAKSDHTYGKLTGSMTLLSDGSTLLRSVNFYNSRGELIQFQSEQLGGGWGTLVLGYDFTGKLVKSIFQYTSNFFVTKKYTFDSYDRLTQVQHKINNAPDYTRVASYFYDALGRMSSKTLGQMSYPVLYEYNIRNWVTGINKVYCDDKTSGHYFGMQIFYEQGYSHTYGNGRIAGVKWRAKGTSSELRSYGYNYDEQGRLVHANYEYHNEPVDPDAWVQTPKDFTASNISYDGNGNLLTMRHMGFDGSAPMILDDLSYTYETGSNKLLSVSESASSQSTSNADHNQLADFRDVSGTDYNYDVNGNLKSDANREINRIDNYWLDINKPLSIVYANGDTIAYTYDAAGNMLSKKITQTLKGVTTVNTFTYFGDVVCRNGSPFLVMHDEGRVRISGTGASLTATYDYFIRDHIGNVRSIITEDAEQNGDIAMDPSTNGNVYPPAGSGVTGNKPPVVYLATSEVENDAYENQLFENISETRADRPGEPDPDDASAASLSPVAGKVLGPGLMLQVMSGDEVQLGAEGFYYSGTAPNDAISLQSLLINIIASVAGATGTVGPDGGFAGMQSASMDPLALTMAMVNMQPYNGDSSSPYAYLNYVMFDESFNLVGDQSGALQVSQANAWAGLDVPRFTVNQNGYLYVFTSNQSQSITAHTDNMYVMHWKGSLLEEFNYYPFGLAFDVSRQAGALRSDIKYNSQSIEQNEFVDDKDDPYGLNWYDFAARNYDPQIGRWLQPDPMMQHSSPYLAMGNNPISFTDPLGLADGPGFWNWIKNIFSSDPEYHRTLTEVIVTPSRSYIPIWSQARETGINGNPWVNDTRQPGDFYSFNLLAQLNSAKGLQDLNTRINDYNNAQQKTNWLKTSSDVFSAGTIGGTLKGQLVEYAVRDHANLSRASFNQLSKYSKTAAEVKALGSTGAKYLRFSKGLGTLGAGIGVASAGYQLFENPTAGNATRLTVQGVAVGTAFIPLAGWAISLSIGAADLIWGDEFYEWIDKP